MHPAPTDTPPRIHPSAIVDPAARIGPGVEVGPLAVVESGVTIEAGARVLGGAWIFRGTTIGAGAVIFPGAILGAPPQDWHFRGDESFVRIGAASVIREGAQVHRATTPGGTTAVGARCLLMANAHVGHDCRVADDVTICNNALLAGHVEVGPRAFISGNVSVHQFTRIGRLAMIGGNAAISRDLPPFFIAAPAAPNRVLGPNTVGLRRAGIAPAARRRIRAAFHAIYRSGLLLSEALAALEADETPEVREIVAFIRGSRRGVLQRASRRGAGEGTHTEE
jgi:UDP-N-acetylglucosamine acyltransferase